ncbi:MAG: hypothetical protein ACXW6T_25315 [Candidatus Binatia bacterium]
MNPTSSIMLQQLAYATPSLIVYLVGMVLAVIFLRKYPGPALLTLLAAIILLVTTVGVAFGQAYLATQRLEYGWSAVQYSQRLYLVTIPGSILRALGAALLLAAVFVGRKSKGAVSP